MLAIEMADGSKISLAQYHQRAISAVEAAGTLDELEIVRRMTLGKRGLYNQVLRWLNAR